MNVSIVSRTTLRNYCYYNKLIKTSLFQNLSDFKKPLLICKCSSFVNITSKLFYYNIYNTDNKQLWNFQQKRTYSEDKNSSSPNRLPPLTPDFPKIMWPSIIKSFRNFILATFIIRPYLDQEFSLPDFVAGSKKAVEVVSQKLADGDVNSLDGLVAKDILPTLQKTISLMTLSQRDDIAINLDDIYFSFPYQVGIIFNDKEGNNQKRFVEITMVYHTLKGLATMKSRGEEPPLNLGMVPEYQRRISICNYRFIREFTKGVDGDWTVNLLNHFKPVDEE